MHSNGLVVAIKHNVNNKLQVLREHVEGGDRHVYIPFGTEYTVFLKNKRSVRVAVSIEIDGKDVAEGRQFILGPAGSSDDEAHIGRSISNGNMDRGNAFLFLKRTSRIEKKRGGIGAEDGLVKVGFGFEKVAPKPVYVPVVPVYPTPWYPPYNPWWDRRRRLGGPTWGGGYVGSSTGAGAGIGGQGMGGSNSGMGGGGTISSNSVGSNSADSEVYTTMDHGFDDGGPQLQAQSADPRRILRSTKAKSARVDPAGITAPGSVKDQRFQKVSSFPLEQERHEIIFQLLGEVAGRKVSEPITVKRKNLCSTCDATNPPAARFCNACGAGLVIV